MDTGQGTSPQPHPWACDVILMDGAPVHLRPARADDAEALHLFLDGLSSATTYLRFFSPRRIDLEEARRMVDVDQRDHVVLLAVEGEEIVAMGSYDRLRDRPDSAEVAFLVEEDHQNRGIGTLLLEHLAAAARENGIIRFTAEVLAENRQMRGVFAEAGFAIQQHAEGSVIDVQFLIEPTDTFLAAIEGREHRAEAASIARLMFPRAVAVIGASRRPDTAGHQVVVNLAAAGFSGRIHPVNPAAEEIAGVPAHPRIGDIPGAVDLAVIAVPAAVVMGVVREAIDKGVHGLVVLTAGFSERGEADAQQTLRDLVRRHGVRLVGPNCIGMVNTATGLDASFSSFHPRRGRVAMMSQSGAVGIALLERSQRTGIGVSTFVSVGNKADVSGNDLLQYWDDDPATDVVLLYLESFGNPFKFSRIARRVSRRKPIVAVKAGRTAAGIRAASSHTAAVTSSDTAVDALFHQTGVIRVDTLHEQFDMAMLLSSQPLPAGPRVAIVGNSGGPGILAADACTAAGLTVEELSAETTARLAEVVDPNGSVANPVDLIATAGPDTYASAIEILRDAAEVDAVLVICTPTFAADPEAIAEVVVQLVDGATPLLGAFLAWPAVPALREGEGGRRVPIFGSPEPAIRALGRARTYAAWRGRHPGTVPDLDDVDTDAVRAVVDRALEAAPEGGWLEHGELMALLGAVGIELPASELVRSAGEAAAAAERIGGAVALKAVGPNLLHKSDIGGVQLDIDGADATAEAYRAMAERLGEVMDSAIVQQMAVPGVETIVGVTHDPLFGPILVFGLGGVATELMRDHAFRVLPLTDDDAAEMIRTPRTSPLLFGYRGSPPTDTEGLQTLLHRVAALATHVPELAEMDLNPVLVSNAGVCAVDARVRLDPTLPRPPSAQRRTA